MIAYDALFIALADAADTPVVTADGKLLKALEGTRYTRLVQPPWPTPTASPQRELKTQACTATGLIQASTWRTNCRREYQKTPAK